MGGLGCADSTRLPASFDDAGVGGGSEVLPALADRDPGGHLLAAGCIGQSRADTGTVVLGVPGDASLLFDCSAVAREGWEAAYREEVEDRIERLRPEGSMIALTGYWQYVVVEVTTTCTSYLGSIELVFEADQSSAVTTPDGQYVGEFTFAAGVPRRFDFYSSFPCTELVLSQGEWVEYDPGEGGGGSGGGGGGGTPPPPPPPSPPLPEEILLEMEWEDLIIVGDTINCGLSQTNAGAAAYCQANKLSEMFSSYLDRLILANDRMRAKGGICAEKAAIVDALMARDAIRTSTTFAKSAWAPIGLGGMGGILIHGSYFTKWYEASRAGRIGTQLMTLQLILSHEVDHLMGHTEHVDSDGLLTIHALECSDVVPD